MVGVEGIQTGSTSWKGGWAGLSVCPLNLT